MNEYTHIQSGTTRMKMLAVASEPVTGTHLLEAVFAGTVVFHKERAAGTLRRWPVLAPESKERKQAEALRVKVEKSGVSKVASASHTSVATVRRTLVALRFTEELEALNAKERATVAKAATANGKAVQASKPAKEEPAAEEPKAEKKSAPKPSAPKGKRGTKAQATSAKQEEQPKEEAPAPAGE